MFEDQRDLLSEVVAVPVTPFAEDGSIDGSSYQKVVRRLMDAGVRALTPNGNTGEFFALTPPEATEIVELTMDCVEPSATVIVGVGHDIDTAVAGAHLARKRGAAMIMIHQPIHPYVSIDGWVAYNKAIADAVPELGVVAYTRDSSLPGEAFARLGDVCPNVIGFKYAVRDCIRFAEVASDAGRDRFTWVAGLAELFAPAYFACGATGFTSGLANVDPATSLALLHALRKDDSMEVQALWERVRPFEELRSAHGNAYNVSVVKEALSQLGVCPRTVRAPITVVPAPLRAEVTALLSDWGALD